MGKPPMPHQQYVWDVALEIDPRTGMLAYSELTVVGPRQVTGKTELIMPYMIHRCTGFDKALVSYAKTEFGIDVPVPGPQRVFFTAQTADDARTRWRDVHVERIKKSAMAKMWSQPPRLTQNKESMFWANGSSWVPGSTTGKTGGTGDTIDLGVIDEAWSRPDNRTELGMRPAQMTRPWSQLVELSMVPGLSRVAPDEWSYLKQKMLTGRQRVLADQRRGRCYIEFSAADRIEEVDIGNPDTWWSCMPGLGYTVPETRVQDDYTEALEKGQLVDFAAEYLGIFPTGEQALWTVISRGTWSDLLEEVPDYNAPYALGMDADPNLTISSISLAALVDDGDVHVELIDRQSGITWLIPALLHLVETRSICAVGIDRNGPLAGLIVPLTRAAVAANLDITIVELNMGQVSAACSSFYSMTGEVEDAESEDVPTSRRIRHAGQPELDQSVGGVVKRIVGNRWQWDRFESTADTGPVFSATLAVAAGDDQEWIGGQYDIRDSLG